MIVNKWRARGNFVLFLAPALLCYLIFAIFPLVLGFWLSMTNWDGSTPWVPVQVSISDFESKYLGKINKPEDKALVLKYYEKNDSAGTYQKRELSGIDRYRIMMIFSQAGQSNPNFKFIGLDNYANVFKGKADPSFGPQTFKESRFDSGTPLDSLKEISKSEWNNNLMPRVSDPQQKKFLESSFILKGDSYILNTQLYPHTDTDLQSNLAAIPGLEDDWENLYNQANAAGAQGKLDGADGIINSLSAAIGQKLTPENKTVIHDTLTEISSQSYLKNILSTSWYQSRTKMGVVLFTIFFTVFNVLLINIIAILLALALDTKMKSRNVLRSVFFIPNVLSMIIVAFIWQLIFNQMLPAVTGIKTWIMNPDLAPWLTVLVATWQGVGYFTVIYLAGLQNIPQEIVESSSMDGAHGFTRFYKIILPLLVPAFTICLFLSTAGALKTFDIIFALYPNTSSQIGVDNIVVNIFYDAFRDKHAGAATAKAVLLMAVILIITGLQMQATKKKEVEL